MAVVTELFREEENGVISFGNHTLSEKAKKEVTLGSGDMYKVKTYQEITKLEKNEMFLYESVPGTSVVSFKETDTEVEFLAEGNADAQITLGLKEDTAYEVVVNGESVGKMSTGFGGKLSLSVALEGAGEVSVKVVCE